MGKKGYGFLHEDSMPHGDFKEIQLKDIEDLDWAVTGPYCDIAKNHCATVCLTNLYKIYCKKGLKGELKENDEIFKKVYGFTGNGPIIALGRKCRRFFRSLGMHMTMKKDRKLDDIISSINNDEPVALLVTGGLFLWHWIICVGVRTYADGTQYLKIMDNWNRTLKRFLPVKKHFTWIRALKFYVEEQ